MNNTYNLQDIKTILLIQLGDIGDVVWMMPTVRAVKETLPASRIYLLLRAGFGSLLEDDPRIEGVFEIKSYPGSLLKRAVSQLKFLRELRSPRFDMAVDMRSGDRGAFMALLSGARRRIAMYYGEGVPFWRNHVFTETVRPEFPPEPVRAYNQTLCIVKKLGFDTDDVVPRLHVSEKNRSRAVALLEQAGILKEPGWITINPFSRWQYKEWGRSKWIEIVDWLWLEKKTASVIVGSPEERRQAEELIRSSKGKAYNLAGRTTLGELAAVLRLSPLHVGVDSAAPHIAAAVGAPTVTIYGPSSWLQWAPISSGHSVVHPDLDCAPCHLKGCNGLGRSRCLEELMPERVKAVIEEALRNRQSDIRH